MITKIATMIENLDKKLQIEKTFLTNFNQWKILCDNTDRDEEQQQRFHDLFTQLLTLVHDPKLNR